MSIVKCNKKKLQHSTFLWLNHILTLWPHCMRACPSLTFLRKWEIQNSECSSHEAPKSWAASLQLQVSGCQSRMALRIQFLILDGIILTVSTLCFYSSHWETFGIKSNILSQACAHHHNKLAYGYFQIIYIWHLRWIIFWVLASDFSDTKTTELCVWIL